MGGPKISIVFSFFPLFFFLLLFLLSFPAVCYINTSPQITYTFIMSSEAAVSYAALILADAEVEISAEKLLALTKAANIEVDSVRLLLIFEHSARVPDWNSQNRRILMLRPRKIKNARKLRIG